jgi:hypothetical protein
VSISGKKNGSPNMTHCQKLGGGGIDSSIAYPKQAEYPPRWKQGLVIFDMTDMTWSSSYNPDVSPYDTPSMFMRWCATGGLESVS